jgi:biopolymer transport protein ExbD
MAGRHARRGQAHRVEVPDLELMPLLNVFISIIPMLLLSAAFVQLAVIPAGLPAASAAAVAAPAPDSTATTVLTLRVLPDAFVVEGPARGVRRIARGGASEPAGRRQLTAVLHELAPALGTHAEVHLVPGAHTRYEEIVDLMDLARDAGLPQVALADGGVEVD